MANRSRKKGFPGEEIEEGVFYPVEDEGRRDSEDDPFRVMKHGDQFSTSLPTAEAIAALAIAYDKPLAYAPINSHDKVLQMSRVAAAMKGQDYVVAPSPGGTMSYDSQPTVDPEEAEINPNKQVEQRQYADGTKEVILQSNYSNAFMVNGKINGRDVTFLVDTGASSVSIPWRIANTLGLDKQMGRKSTARTAGGLVEIIETSLDSLEIGHIQLNSVSATINQGDRSDQILLGMSALRRLEFTHANDQIILRQRP